MKSSPSIWHYVVSVKSAVKISSIFVAFLENTNFTIILFRDYLTFSKYVQKEFLSISAFSLLIDAEKKPSINKAKITEEIN